MSAKPLRVLPPVVKDVGTVVPGQVYLDRRGRVLWVQRIIPELAGSLCHVLNATGKMWRGAYVKHGRLGRLVKDAPERPCRLVRACNRKALLLDPRDEEPFCSTRCWQLSGRDPGVVEHGLAVDA